MIGKILKISSNDLYGNVDDRHVVVFAAFNHVRYMNKYVIFTFEGEFNKKKLYYGSLHLKDNSLVVFSVNDATKKFIDAFVDSYLRGNVDPTEYTLIDISNTSKVELVSYNERDFDYISTRSTVRSKTLPRLLTSLLSASTPRPMFDFLHGFCIFC